jgi:hypothetical protein
MSEPRTVRLRVARNMEAWQRHQDVSLMRASVMGYYGLSSQDAGRLPIRVLAALVRMIPAAPALDVEREALMPLRMRTALAAWEAWAEAVIPMLEKAGEDEAAAFGRDRQEQSENARTTIRRWAADEAAALDVERLARVLAASTNEAFGPIGDDFWLKQAEALAKAYEAEP